MADDRDVNRLPAGVPHTPDSDDPPEPARVARPFYDA